MEEVIKMKVKILIPTPDDSRHKYSTSFLFRTTNTMYSYKTRLNKFGEYVIGIESVDRYKDSLDPTYSVIEDALKVHLFPTHLRWNNSSDNMTGILTFRYKDGDSTVVFQKSKPHFFLNGARQNKSIVLGNIARIIFRSCFERSSRTMDKYISRLLLFPPNVTHAIENRTSYNFWLEGKKYEVRLTTKPISDVECALEISDGIWAPIKVNDLNGFINFHRFDKRRSQRWGISPKYLWANLIGSPPTMAQEKLMIEFLKQNRTQDIVEDRANQLLSELEEEYPNRIIMFDFPAVKARDKDKNSTDESLQAMFVRGKICDWIIIDNQYKSNIQRVSTYLYLTIDNGNGRAGRERIPFDDGHLVGPICIDNIHRNSSKGDQFAARAMALLNDSMTVAMVHTIKSYIPQDILDRKIECRINSLYPNGMKIKNGDNNDRSMLGM